MTFRVGFWTSATSYITVLLLYQASLSTAGHLFFGASMGGLVGLILASMFARRANRAARVRVIHAVLREKQHRVEQVRREIAALEIAIPLLVEDHGAIGPSSPAGVGQRWSA